MDHFMNSQLDALKQSLATVRSATYMSVLQGNLSKLRQADQLGYGQMSELFEFFRPLVQKDSSSSNFSFVCKQPNFDHAPSVDSHIDAVLEKNSKALFEIRKVINRLQKISADFNFQPAADKSSSTRTPTAANSSSAKGSRTNQLSAAGATNKNTICSKNSDVSQDKGQSSTPELNSDNSPQVLDLLNLKKAERVTTVRQVMSDVRLQLRSLEHFCDAIEIFYLNVWSLSFRVQCENVSLVSFNHFPLFIYTNSYCQSLACAEIQIYLIEGQAVAGGSQIYSQKATLDKTNLKSNEEDYFQMMQLDAPVKLAKDQVYTLAIANVTQEQLDNPGLRLFLCLGEQLAEQQLPATRTEGCLGGAGTPLVTYLNADYGHIDKFLCSDSGLNSSQISFGNRIEDQSNVLSDYFIPNLGFQIEEEEEEENVLPASHARTASGPLPFYLLILLYLLLLGWLVFLGWPILLGWSVLLGWPVLLGWLRSCWRGCRAIRLSSPLKINHL